jgi:hypothetical protein
MEGYEIPLQLDQGLLMVPLCCPMEEDLLLYLIVMISSDLPWDPKSLNDDDSPSCHLHHISKLDIFINEAGIGTQGSVEELMEAVQLAANVKTEIQEEDYEVLCPFLGWVPKNMVKWTLENTTRLAKYTDS